LICQDELEQGHGLSLIQRCKALQPQLKTLVLVSQVQGFRWKQALELGVDAVCNRQRLGRGVFLDALRSLQGEGTYLDRSLLAGPSPEQPQLTPRELEVLQGLHQGDQTKELARRLGLGPNTVKGYVRQIHQKLGVRCRTQAVLQGLKVGLIKAD
jgi:DNA-binding NarL/FixJ family response regulator